MAEKAKKWKIAFIVMLAVSLVSTIIAISSFAKPMQINIQVPYETVEITDTETSVTDQENASFFAAIWNVITEYVAPLADFFVVIISISIFGLTYVSKKISIVGFTEGIHVYEGYKVVLTLKNETLSDMSIKKVRMIIDDKSALLIKQYTSPHILGPLKALNFESDNYSISPIKDSFAFSGKHKVKAEITLSDDRIIFAKISKKLYFKRRNKKSYETIHPLKVMDGDSLITESMLYKVLICKNEEMVDSFIILQHGSINKTINGCHCLPKECLQSKEMVKTKIEELYKNQDYTVEVYDHSIETLMQ